MQLMDQMTLGIQIEHAEIVIVLFKTKICQNVMKELIMLKTMTRKEISSFFLKENYSFKV